MFHQLVITLIIIRMHDTKDLGPQKTKTNVDNINNYT